MEFNRTDHLKLLEHNETQFQQLRESIEKMIICFQKSGLQERRLKQLATAISKELKDHKANLSLEIQRCFVDNNRNAPLEAKIGLVGLEKAGKSTMISCWATNGESATLLPSHRETCTGTIVRMYSSTNSVKKDSNLFSAVVEFFNQDDILRMLIPAIASLSRDIPDLFATDSLPEIQKIAQFHSTGISNFRLDRLINDLEAVASKLEWQNLQITTTETGQPALPINSAAALINKYILGWEQYRVILGTGSQSLHANTADELGIQLWPYISVIDRNVNGVIPNYIQLGVKCVSIYGPLPGLPPRIQLNDLPGLDSASDELNAITKRAYLEMDILIFVKNPVQRSELTQPERELLNNIRRLDENRGMDRVVAVITGLDNDIIDYRSIAECQCINAANKIQEFTNIPHDRIRFVSSHYAANVQNCVSRVHQAADKQKFVVDGICSRNFTINEQAIDGFEYLTESLISLVEMMPSRDVKVSARLQNSLAHIKELTLDFVQSIQPSFQNTNQASTLSRLFHGDTKNRFNDPGLFALVLNTLTQKHIAVLPNNGTLYYFKPYSNFTPADDCKNKFPFISQTDTPETLIERIRNKLVTTQEIEGTKDEQEIEDNKCLEYIEQSFQTSQVGDQLINTFKMWLSSEKCNKPISFSIMESHYRMLIRDYFLKTLDLINAIDSANVLNTLDNLIIAVLLVQTQEDGCLLNTFTKGNSDELRSMMQGIKERIFDKSLHILHHGASRHLNYLLGVQKDSERESLSKIIPANSTNKTSLESLFHVPFKLTDEDIINSPGFDLPVGDDNVLGILRSKMDRVYIESDDFEEYKSDSKSPIIHTCFPPDNSKELEVLISVIHTRSMKALEHIVKIICSGIRNDYSLALARQKVQKDFLAELKNEGTSLFGICDKNKAAIWEQCFGKVEAIQTLANVTNDVQRLIS